MTTNFIPAANAATLSQRSAAALRAVSELMEMIVNDLPEGKQASLGALLDGGGRVGVELTVDKSGANKISLVGVEREGRHRTLATIATIGTGNTH